MTDLNLGVLEIYWVKPSQASRRQMDGQEPGAESSPNVAAHVSVSSAMGIPPSAPPGVPASGPSTVS